MKVTLLCKFQTHGYSYIVSHLHFTGDKFLHRSDDWRQFSEAEKKEIGLTYDDDGEFWYACQYVVFNTL